jgi:hypothetical protein
MSVSGEDTTVMDDEHLSRFEVDILKGQVLN